jgi:hypothetical protein
MSTMRQRRDANVPLMRDIPWRDTRDPAWRG